MLTTQAACPCRACIHVWLTQHSCDGCQRTPLHLLSPTSRHGGEGANEGLPKSGAAGGIERSSRRWLCAVLAVVRALQRGPRGRFVSHRGLGFKRRTRTRARAHRIKQPAYESLQRLPACLAVVCAVPHFSLTCADARHATTCTGMRARAHVWTG